MGQLRAAVVGVGYLGTFHAQKYKQLSEKQELNITLVGVCDLNGAQAQKVAQEIGVTAYTKPEQLIGQVDMVTLATITPTHFELAKYFLSQGIHVNVEKPICLRSEEAEQLVQLAKEKKLVLCVGHSERFNPAYRELRKRTSKISYLEFNRYAPFKLRGSDVSVLHDLMIHDLDLLLKMSDGKPKLISARAGKLVTKTYDWCVATYEFENGLKAQLNCSRMAKEMTRTIRAIDEKQIWISNLQTGEIEQSQIVQSTETPVAFQVHSVGRGDNLLAETEAFALAVHGQANEAVTGQDGMQALELVEQIIAYLDSDRGR